MNENSILVGFSPRVKLSVHLDHKDRDAIYMGFDGDAARRFSFADLVEFAAFIAAFDPASEKSRKAGAARAPQSACGAIAMENGNVKVKLGDISRVFDGRQFANFAETIAVAERNARNFIKKRDAKKAEAAAIEELDRPDNLMDRVYYAGYYFVLFLMGVDVLLLAAGIFNPVLFYAVGIITPAIVLAFFLIPKGQRANMADNRRDYMDNRMIGALSSISLSRRSAEFITIVFIAMVFIIVYFSKAMPFIMDFWKSYFGR